MGYVHGDAHMKNFMLDYDGNVKIIDFGSVRPYNANNYLVDYTRIKDYGEYNPEYEDVKNFIDKEYNIQKRLTINETKDDDEKWEKRWEMNDDIITRYQQLERKILKVRTKLYNEQDSDLPNESLLDKLREKLYNYELEKNDLYDIIRETVLSHKIAENPDMPELKIIDEYEYKTTDDVIAEYLDIEARL
jgi:serine/threonine protein kinase